MSTTTILETYDTQMVEDYPSGDYDIAMHTAGSSSDVWYHGESLMDQDAQHDSEPHAAPDRGSVEIEMEETYPDADHESVEYEMADEEAYRPAVGELLDVEVYDASQLHSPAPIPTIGLPQTTADNTFIVQSDPILTGARETIVTSDPPPPILDEGHENAHVPSDYDIPAAEIPTNSIPRSNEDEEGQNTVVSPTENQAEQPDNIHTTENQTLLNDSVIHRAADHEASVKSHEVSDSDVVQDVEHTDNHSHAHGDDTELPTNLPHPQEHEAAAQPAQVDASTNADYHTVEGYSEGVQQLQQHDDATADAVDPHEISDGIYIDPPPAVLLSISSDAAHTEICLFNQPLARAGSSSPTEEISPSTQETLALLLHHRPTLYYEPLTNVFEALRQEEYITQVTGFAEGELVLDAYDLQLVISEDNTHARDVTLHDLNILHDGSDLSGPLRLYLHAVVPRFILRYHMLRDQIARLNLAAEAESEQLISHEEHITQTEEHHPEDAQNEETNQDLENNPPQASEHHDELAADHTEEPALPDPPASVDQTDQGADDISNLPAEENGDYQDHEDETRAHENTYTQADADATFGLHEEDTTGDISEHQSAHDDGEQDGATAPVGDDAAAEYEDYAEPGEQYGEVTPDDESGEGADASQTLDSIEPGEGHEATSFSRAPETLLNSEVQQESAVVDLIEIADNPAHQLTELNVIEVNDEDAFEELDNTNAEEETYDTLDHDSVGTVSKQGKSGVDESDANFVAMLENEADLVEPVTDITGLESQNIDHHDQEYPPLQDDEEWDDDLDAEGDIDPAVWPVDQDDGISNQSTATLSSSTSLSKRGRDETDFGDEYDGDGDSLQSASPGSKRPRVA